MIKFFRKIRYNLIETRKTGKYLTYAIGEIILVVIGILIALAINDSYNNSKNEEKVIAILKQVQQEILANVKDCDRIFGYFVDKDAKAQNIYKDLISVESKPGDILITQGYTNLSVNAGGYNRLMDNIEILPEKYKVLLPIMNMVYVEELEDVHAANAYLSSKAKHSNLDRLYTDPEHTDHLRTNFSSLEARKYLLDDPFLKNRTADYMRAFSSVADRTTRFRTAATELYLQIDSLLGNPRSQLPKILIAKASVEMVSPYIGEYTHFAGTEWTKVASLNYEKEQLTLTTQRRKMEVFWHKDNYFYNRTGVILRLYKNENNQVFLDITDGVKGQTLIKR